MEIVNPGNLSVLTDVEVTLRIRQMAQHRLDADYANRVSEYMDHVLGDGANDLFPREFARAMLGKNIFGVEEWIAAPYGVTFTGKQLHEVAGFPWGEDILNAPCDFIKGKRVRETHFAYLGLDYLNGEPVTILKQQELHPRDGQPRFASYSPSAWYSLQKFANGLAPKFRWYLMLQNIVPNSEKMSYEKQKAMLPPEYEVPFAAEETLKLLFFYQKNGIYLNSSVYGRTEGVPSGGYRVRVGSGDGIRINICWDEIPYEHVGVAASRKLPAKS